MRGAVRVGDFCQIDGITETVEDIGISALSLRTLDRSIVSIPNSKVAEVGLQNFQLRDQFWLPQIFTLEFDTRSKGQQDTALSKLRLSRPVARTCRKCDFEGTEGRLQTEARCQEWCGMY